MSLFPTQYGNVFGGNNNNGRSELVSFNAGKMTVKPTANGKFLITPDLKKGKVSLTRGDDQLLHFQWTDRQSGASPDDFIIFPDDATFSRANTGREKDRVYLLQYKNSARRFFFWMQHKDGSRDEELAKKVNDYMNNAAPAGGSEGGRGAGNTQLDHNAIMQMLGAMGAGGDQGRGGAAGGAGTNVQVSDLQNILQNMGLPASQVTGGSPATSAASSSQTSHSGGASSAAATTASTHDHDVGMEVDDMTEEELLRLAIEESMRDVDGGSAAAPAAPPAAPVTPAPTPQPAATPAPPAPPVAASAPGMITAADLQRAMASIQAFTQQPKSVSLSKLLRPENITPLLNDEAVVNALIQHLPEGNQNAYELQETLRSPQLRQSIGSLVSALHSGNFNAVLANFGLDPAAGAAKLAFGDGVGAFLDAIQHWANQQDTTMTDDNATNK